MGFYVLGKGRWELSECAYMTVITLSTVGFGELDKMHEVPGARPLTIMLIISGVGALAYVQGNLTALLVEGPNGLAALAAHRSGARALAFAGGKIFKHNIDERATAPH